MTIEAHTREDWGKINFQKKSNGHIMFDDDMEYFQYNTSVYRAKRTSPVECTGIREDSRFVSTIAAWSTLWIIRAKQA